MSILVTGSTGMLGRHVLQNFKASKIEVLAPARNELDLLDQSSVEKYFLFHKPKVVIHCAAVVGGILENIQHPTQFILTNSLIDSHTINAALNVCVEHFMYISSSCIYPAVSMQPMLETAILSGELEATNKSYAIAKLSGMQIMESIRNEYGLNYRSIISSNLYGPFDNFNLAESHLVASALIKTLQARHDNQKEVVIFGSGKPRREFTFASDLAEWICNNLQTDFKVHGFLNIGLGIDYTVLEIYQLAAQITGFDGKFILDSSKPDGMYQKLMDSNIARTKYGWNPTTDLKAGMRQTYDWLVKQ